MELGLENRLQGSYGKFALTNTINPLNLLEFRFLVKQMEVEFLYPL